MAPGENLVFFLAMTLYGLAMISYWIAVVAKSPSTERAGLRLVWAGVIVHAAALILRTLATKYAPMTNLYESLSFFAWLCAGAYLFAWYSSRLPILGCFTLPICLGLMGMATGFRPERIEPLMPALRSGWILPAHVAIAFLGEACFAVGFAAATLYLLKVLNERISSDSLTPGVRSFLGLLFTAMVWLALGGLATLALRIAASLEPALAVHASSRGTLVGIWLVSLVLALVLASLLTGVARRAVAFISGVSPSLAVLDRISYGFIIAGYPLFLLGALVLGMLWAHQAWGRYWGWDPKEIWALITFLVYSLYLHARLVSNWKGVWAAVFAVAGFVVTLFTFLGVNLLLSGLHSYASG